MGGARGEDGQPDLDGSEFETGPWVEMLQDLDLQGLSQTCL